MDLLGFRVQSLLSIDELLIKHASVDLESPVVEANSLTATEVQFPVEIGHHLIRLHNIGRLMNLALSVNSVLQVGFRLIMRLFMTGDKVVFAVLNELLQGFVVLRSLLAVDILRRVGVTNVVLEIVHDSLDLQIGVETELTAELGTSIPGPQIPIFVLRLRRVSIKRRLNLFRFLKSFCVRAECTVMHHARALHLLVEALRFADVLNDSIRVPRWIDSHLST